MIVLLPFTPGGVASGGHAVAGALMEDLQFYLTRGSGCRVVVGGLATVHAAQELGLRQVGRDMAARYIISGAVHSFRNSLRITAHLTDAADGAQLWSERTTIERDSQTEALEAAIQRTTWSLMRQLYAAEGIRAELEGESDPTALLARGRAVGLRSYSRETIRTTRRYYEHALASDPGSVEAMAALGEQLVLSIVDRWSDDEAADTIRAEGLLRRALSAAPYSYTAYAGLGTLLRWQGQSDQAVAVLRRGLDIYPSPYAFRKLGLSLLYDGNAGEALSCIQRAAEMSDIEANRVNSTWALGACHQTLGEADEATTYLLKARASDPNLPCVRVRLAACFAQIGDLEEARRELCAAQAHKHHKTLAEIAEMPQVRQYNYRGRCEETFYAGLRLAGIVER